LNSTSIVHSDELILRGILPRMPITTGFNALKTAFDIGNAINQRVKENKIYPNEIAAQLLHMQQLILESQQALNEAAEEIRLLKEQAAARNRDEELERDMEWQQDGGFWIRKSDQSAGKHIPYCPLCWGDNKRLVPLNPSSGLGYFQCPIHKSSHETNAYKAHCERQERSMNIRNREWIDGDQS
jgi:hypothetical protein